MLFNIKVDDCISQSFLKFYINHVTLFFKERHFPVSTHFYSIIYADDTTLNSILSSFKTNSFADGKINNELDKISEWLKVNKLSINIKKTKYMISIHHKRG